jgi:tRNA 2-thiouridine synthesizing protein C
MKNFSPAYRALAMYDVEKLYVEKESMEQRGLTADDLIVPVEILSTSGLADLMEQRDVILDY